ncbi:MAG: ABC transporter substrate-binding protein [Candidatus Aminicenantes bacterium]|jgi:ABC-type transport system substrate-binding protein
MSRKLTWLLAVILLFLLGGPSLLSRSAGIRKDIQPNYGGIFRLKSFTDVYRTELDPISPNSFIFLSEQIYDGLVGLDKNLHIQPALAEYWEISSDKKVYTFYLRKGVKFHHGEVLDAADVKYSLERILDKESNSPYYQFFVNRVEGAADFREGRSDHVRGYSVVDDFTFKMKLTKPFVSALYLMSMNFCKILPREKATAEGRDFFRRPSGTGPFMFDFWVRTTRLEIAGIHLKRNPEYFAGPPYLDGIEFCSLFTIDHFYNEEIDAIPILSRRLLDSEFQLYEDGPMTHYFLGLSCRIPPLNRASVRKALSLGFDKQSIVEAAKDIKYLRTATNNYIPSSLPGFFPPHEGEPSNLVKAKEMLEREGFSENDRFPRVTVYFKLPRTDEKHKIYRELRDQLRNLNIDSRLNFYESPKELHKTKAPYMIFVERNMSFPDPEDMIRPLFHSKSLFNVFGYTNPKLDDLLQMAEVERSWKKRIGLFHKIEEVLFEDVPAIPLFSHQNRVAIQPYVRGVEYPSLGFYYLDAKKIWLDK